MIERTDPEGARVEACKSARRIFLHALGHEDEMRAMRKLAEFLENKVQVLDAFDRYLRETTSMEPDELTSMALDLREIASTFRGLLP